MKQLYEDNEFIVLEVDECGHRLPDFVLIKVNDFTKTYRTQEILEKRIDKLTNHVTTMLEVIKYAKDSLTPNESMPSIDQALAHLEIYDDFDLEKELK